MGKRGPKPKAGRTSGVRPAVTTRVVGGDEEAARVAAARERVPEAGLPFFDAVSGEYTAWTSPELEHLARAGQAIARIEEAREQVAEDGILVDGARGGRVRHPALLVERAALADLRASLAALRLDEAAAPDPYPPARGSRSRGRTR